jgi:hypothetical protein
MEAEIKYLPGVKLTHIPSIDDCEYMMIEQESGQDVYVAAVDAKGEQRVVAFIDAATGAAFPCGQLGTKPGDNPRDRGEEPLVKLVGTPDEQTGQIVIKQTEGHWRRYSRWDKVTVAPPTQPHAVVRTLPQCGCGGYLGAPSMFDSFEEMIAYFFVVFSDAQAVNAKHAANLRGDACCAI